MFNLYSIYMYLQTVTICNSIFYVCRVGWTVSRRILWPTWQWSAGTSLFWHMWQVAVAATVLTLTALTTNSQKHQDQKKTERRKLAGLQKALYLFLATYRHV